LLQPAGKVGKAAGPQKIICFSPHPDDDVISMGGTLLQLVADGHEVHVAYMTSGNIAVFDHDALRFADFVSEYNAIFELEQERAVQLETQVQEFLRTKKAGQLDSPAVQRIKSLIRKTEAKAAAGACGIPEEQLHFLDLPFYQTGRVAKLPVSDDDVRIVRDLLDRLRPAQVYVAGDLSDPHGTHRMCADAILGALRELNPDGYNPEVWLYRGAWQEWGPHEIERAVPLSPSDLQRKKVAIFMHESQKDAALFPGPYDTREFWQRAVDRNRNTAELYDRLGLPEYFALEGFVQWKPDGAE
jgi:glucosamine-6-phosphate deaminase